MQNQTVKISAVIITFNEEKNIARCIESLQGVADEIVIVDSYSTDRTKEICFELGVRFIEHAFAGYVEQKNYAVQQASYDHVLSLDADEAISPELRESILIAKKNWTHDGYKCNRLTNYCGTWIRHCGWYPDTKLRLWDRRKGTWTGFSIHESLTMHSNTTVGYLSGDLLHYSYYTLSQHVAQIDKFTTIMAEEDFQKKKKVSTLLHLVINPTVFFLKRYLLNRGFLDGYMGYIVCKNGAYYKFLKYAKLRELYRQNKSNHL